MVYLVKILHKLVGLQERLPIPVHVRGALTTVYGTLLLMDKFRNSFSY